MMLLESLAMQLEERRSLSLIFGEHPFIFFNLVGELGHRLLACNKLIVKLNPSGWLIFSLSLALALVNLVLVAVSATASAAAAAEKHDYMLKKKGVSIRLGEPELSCKHIPGSRRG